MTIELQGVEIPIILEKDVERARAYAAGYLLYQRRKIDRVPEELQSLCNQYAPDRKSLERSGLHYPNVSRIESSFWSGYLTSASASRDRRRSNSKEATPRDLTTELKNSRTYLDKDFNELFGEEDIF